MTATFFANARIIDPVALTDAPGCVLVVDGLIHDVTGIDATPPVGAKIVDCGGMCLAPGIIDIGVKVSEPGERHKESFRSAGRAAAAGGVTTMVTNSSRAARSWTHPCMFCRWRR